MAELLQAVPRYRTWGLAREGYECSGCGCRLTYQIGQITVKRTVWLLVCARCSVAFQMVKP